MKRMFKELYDEFNVPINNQGNYLELGGFIICILFFLLGLFAYNEFIHPISGMKQLF